jgi:hypothetical protein
MYFSATEILNQLTQCDNGMHRLGVMISAKYFSQDKEAKHVSFRWSAKAANKANYCKITLNNSDTYDVEFGYIRGMNYTVRSEISGLYADQLKDYFEGETENYLSL